MCPTCGLSAARDTPPPPKKQSLKVAMAARAAPAPAPALAPAAAASLTPPGLDEDGQPKTLSEYSRGGGHLGADDTLEARAAALAGMLGTEEGTRMLLSLSPIEAARLLEASLVHSEAKAAADLAAAEAQAIADEEQAMADLAAAEAKANADMAAADAAAAAAAAAAEAAVAEADAEAAATAAQGGALQVETRVESAWFQRLKLAYDELLLSSAVNFNLRRYTKGLRMATPPRTGVGPTRICSKRTSTSLPTLISLLKCPPPNVLSEFCLACLVGPGRKSSKRP